MKESVVYSTWDEPMAFMAFDLLKGMGFHPRVLSDMVRSVYPFTMDGLGEIQIVVPEEEKESAIELLSVRFSDEGVIENSGEDELDWNGCRDSDEEGESTNR